MVYDLKITGGLIHDGDGGEPYVADVAVSDGLIVQIGPNLGPAAREIDAKGLLVTPGFIDPHTHYDAQALWDTELETSIRHGVTTAIGGNCGVGFAPLLTRDKADVISLMAGVEDIPSAVLREGLNWDWTSFADYLDRMAAVPRPIDVGFNVPHDCVRLMVMGERAAAQEQATPDDIAQMTQVLKDSLLAGGVGFSFGRVFGHRTDDGRNTPSYNASHEELVALSGVLKDLPYRVLQGVTDGRIAEGPEAFDAEYAVIGKMVRAADRPVSLNLHQRSKPEFSQGAWRKVMAAADAVGDDMVRFQCNTKSVGSLYGLTSTINLLSLFPTFRAIQHLPLAEQVAILRRPETRARLLAETPELLPGDPPKMAGVKRTLDNLDAEAGRIFRMGDVPNCEPQADESLAHHATTHGLSVLAAYYDLSLEDDGQMLLDAPAMNYVDGNLNNLYEMLNHPGSFFGVGDAGAHLGYVCDVGYSTMAMAFWGGGRDGDTLALPTVVRMLTGKVADHFGFTDRGRVKVGLRADLNVIDYANIKLYRPRHVADLPAGGQRFLQDAQGYRAVLVAGVAVLENDTPTGAKPGKVLRAAAA